MLDQVSVGCVGHVPLHLLVQRRWTLTLMGGKGLGDIA